MNAAWMEDERDEAEGDLLENQKPRHLALGMNQDSVSQKGSLSIERSGPPGHHSPCGFQTFMPIRFILSKQFSWSGCLIPTKSMQITSQP